MRQTVALGVLATIFGICAMAGVRALQPGSVAPRPLAAALGARQPDAPLTRQPAKDVSVRIGRHSMSVSRPEGRVSLAGTARSGRAWTRYENGVQRRTSFGRETVVVTPAKAEQFLTVNRRQGPRTWRWQLDAGRKLPRVGDDGAVAFLANHKLAAMSVDPVEILDTNGRKVTPDGLRWSVRQNSRGWQLQLRLDDSKLPLPYVIDPAVSYRTVQVSNNGAGGAASITMAVPAGVVNKDLLFMHISARGGSNMTINTPAGWTALRNTNSFTTIRLATFYRIASSEPASYSVTFGGGTPSQQAVGAISAYYGVKSSSALDMLGATGTGNSATPSAASINATAGSLVLAAYSLGTGSGGTGTAMFTTAAGMNERYDAQSLNGTAGNRASVGGDDILTAAGGATGAKAVTATASARWVAHQVSFNEDDVAPTGATTFPAGSGTYNAAGWAAGCGTAGICGTAADADSAVQKVEVSIRQGSGNYWNGAAFASASEVWNLATGTTNWSYNFNSFPADGSYTVRVQVTDVAVNAAVISTIAFTYDTTAPVLPTSLASSPVSPANNNSPAITGTAEAGSTVKIYTTAACTGAPTATGTAAAFASPGISVAVSDDTSTTFKATATDVAGNVSGCSTSSVTYVEDSTAPALPASLASSPVSPANNNAPAISGTAEAGSTVKIYTTAACTGAPTATGTAATFASPGISVAVSDNTSTTFKATATDAAGNVSGCSTSSVTYVEDSNAPALPTSLASTPAGPANNNSPAISGTAEAGSTVKIYTTAACTGAPTATGTAAAFSSPGITVAVADDTSTTFKATATDAAGNVSGCSTASVTYVEDSTAPALPSGLGSTPVSPANNNSPAISGTAEAGSTVKIYTTAACTGAPTATGTAAAFASPGISVAVSDDTSTTFKATATDAAGNVSGCSTSSVTYVEDSTAPALPASLASSPVSPANNNSPAISGSAEAGSTVKVYTTASCTGAPVATGTAAAFSSPGFSISVSDDTSTTFKATATDAAGNVSGCSTSAVTYVEDSTAPSLPASLASSPVSPANNNTPSISGSAEAGSTVKIYTTASCTGAPTATGTAAAFSSPGLAVSVSDDTSTTFKATATDAAGNVSGCSSSSVTYVEDSTAPALPSGLGSTPVSPANNNSPAITGTAEAGSTVKLYTTATCTGAPTATGTAAAFSSPGIAVAVSDDTSTTFKATSTDAAGNVSGCSSSSVTYVEDSTAPALPASLASTPAGPANNNSPAISGTAEAGSTVKLYTTATCTGAPTATGTAAAFSSPGITVAVADDSSATFKATATDAAGNVSGCSSSSVTYVEDSTAPALPTSLASTPAGPANNNSPAISGTAEAGSTVKIYTTASCTGVPTATGTAAAFASPGITVSVSDDTSTTFKATSTDAAGNVSGCSTSSVTYVEDSAAPATPSSLAATPAGPANNNSPAISGTAEAGSTVKLYTTASCTGAPTASGSAAAFATGIAVAVADDSSTTFKATATDAAGNVSGCSAGVTYVEDSTAPALPSSLASTPAGPANNNSPSISGTAEAGSTVKIYTTAACTGAPTATGTAAAFASGIAVAVADDSSTTFKATATDAAGNVSGCSTSSVTYVEDSTAPANPSSLAVTPAGPANNNSPAISGTAEAGSTVKIYTTAACTGAPTATGTAAAFATGIAVAVADDSTTTFKATSTDAAGNVSGCSTGVTYVEDSTAPALPASLTATPVGPANDNSPKISGTAEAGSTVKIYTTPSCTGAPTATGTAAAFSSPGITVAVADDSSTTFKATATDAAGNVSGCSTSAITYQEDSTAPALPTSLAATPAGPANNNSPAISGSAEAGSTVKLYTTAACTGAPAASGSAATFASGIAVAVADDSTTTFKATATDSAGNVSGCSGSSVTYVEDSTSPNAPAGLGTAPASPANDNAPKVYGAAEAGSTIDIYTTSDCSGAPAATGSAGTFASPGLTVAVSDDTSTTFKATATDAAGNVSGCSAGTTYVEDSTAPALPASLASTPAGPANDNSPQISGSAEAGSTVKLYTTSDCSGAPTATGSAATFATGITVAVADDSSTTFKATATDASGNVSGCSTSSTTYVEDSTAPALPASLAATPAGPANDNSPQISGSAEAGSTVDVYTTSDCSGAPTATGSAATFATGITVAVPDDSTTTFNATATDAAGNVSGCSTSDVTYVEDSSSPTAPSALAASPAGPANDNSPSISGAAEAGSTVDLYTTSDCSGAPTASGTAAAFATGIAVTVADDTTTTFKATATDAAGNVSACSAGVTYVEDSSAPAAPSSLDSTPQSPANDNSPKIGGSAEAGSTVDVYATNDCSGSVAASGDAATFASPGLDVSVADDSTTSFTATSTDSSGNVSACSSTLDYQEDSTAPSSTFDFPAASGVYSPASWTAGCPTPGVCGTAGDGSGSGIQKVELSIRDPQGDYYDGSSFASASEVYLTASGHNAWSYGLSQGELPLDGDYTLHVKSTDYAGNEEIRLSRAFTFDASAPSAPSLSFSNLSSASVTGQTVYFRGGAAGGFTVGASSSDPDSGIAGYTFPGLGSGWSGSQSGSSYDYSFNASASDPVEPNDVSAQNGAGLSSSTSFTVTRDSAAPASSIACDGSSCSGNWYTSSVSISLSAVDGGSGVQVIRYTTDGSDPTPVNGSDYAAPFGVAATTTVKFRAYDAVGNEEAVGSQLVKVDDTAPSAPALTVTESPADPHQFVTGTTLFYNPQGGNSGSFKVAATTADAQSGIDHVNFPALAGMAGGGDDPTSPYSDTYSWDASSTEIGSQNVTSVNGAGLTNASSFTVTPDTAPPAGGSVDYVDGYASGSVTITTADGSDAQSGVNAATGVIERDSAPLVNGVCDPFPGSWTTVVSPDVTITSGHCYRYRYRVSDNVSNEAVYTSAHVVMVSTGAPSSPDLTLTETPASPNQFVAGGTLFYNPAGSNSGTFTVDATVADSGGSGIDHVNFLALAGMTGGGDDPTSPYQASYDWDSSSSASGAQVVTVYNNAGLTSTAAFVVTPDTAGPVGQWAITAGAYHTTLSVPVTLNDGADALSGVDHSSALLEREDATLSNGSCVSWSGSWSPVTLTAGADTTVQTNHCYHYRYSISDNVGNSSGASAVSPTEKVDATAPVTSDDAPAGWQSSAVTVTLSVVETGAGTASTQYRVDGGAFQSGTTILVPAPADHSNDGVHTIEYRSTDNAGNVETLRSATVRIDTTLPTTTDDAPAGWQSSAVTVTLTASDALSGIASTQYRVDGGSFQSGTTILVPAPADHSNDGAHLIEYASTDNAGNAESLHSATVRIDTTLPTGAVTSPANGTHVNGNVALTASASDAGSGVASVEFLVRPNGSGSFTSISTDTTAPYEATWDSTTAAEGNADLEVVVLDQAGLSYTSASITLVVDNPPAPSLADPGANIAGTVTLQASSQPDTAQVAFERRPVGQPAWTQIGVDTTAPYTTDFDTTAVADGNYELRAVATDTGGFSGASALRTTKVDNTVPTASMTDPVNGAVVGGPNVHLWAAAGDSGSGVASVRFEQRQAGGVSFTAISTDTTAPYEGSWNTTGLNGNYELRAVALDAAGNETASAVVAVVVDQATPSVTLGDPGTLVHGVLPLSATSVSARVASVAFERRATGGAWTRIALDTSAPWAADFDTKQVADGGYDLRAVALDSTGNVLATHAREGIKIDNTAPTLVSSKPAAGADVLAPASIVLTASEPVASVQNGSLDAAPATAQISGSTVTFSADGLKSGKHALAGVLVDAAGNKGSFSLSFTTHLEAQSVFALHVQNAKAKKRGGQEIFSVRVNLSSPAQVTVTLYSPTGRKLRTVRKHLPAGLHTLKLAVPVSSLPPGRYTIRVSAAGDDGSKLTKTVTVKVPRAAVKAHPAVAPKSVTPAAPPPAPAPALSPSTTPTPESSAPRTHTATPPPAPQVKPKPNLHKPTQKLKPLETGGAGYSGSKSHRTAGLAAAIVGIGAALALLLRVELGRILASPRR